MGNIPKIGQLVRIPVVLSTPAYLMDHRFREHPVMPAVETMEILVRVVLQRFPDLAVKQISDLRLDKFLFLDPLKEHLQAMVELHPLGGPQWQAALVTRSKAPNCAITRTKVHARLDFSETEGCPPLPCPLDVACVPEGVCRTISPDAIYSELVPLGPAFQNIQAPLFISPDGALAQIKTPPQSFHTAAGLVLGSPYALDAAFHAACVWAQHYKSVVAFPVGIDRRTVLRPTTAGQTYFARVFPKSVTGEVLKFDIHILDSGGDWFEIAEGVRMRDVSGGQLEPVQWILRDNDDDPLNNLRQQCQALTIAELEAVAPFADKTLTALEKERFERMGIDRRKSFLAARIALKRLWRRHHGEDWMTLAVDIETVEKQSPRPCCENTPDVQSFRCSVSHDKRFAVAAGDSAPLGVDVEAVCEKALASASIFMDANEQRLVFSASEEPRASATRIWSIKEAVAKAAGLNLAEAWQHARVVRLNRRESLIQLDGNDMTIHHCIVENHLFTLFLNKSAEI